MLEVNLNVCSADSVENVITAGRSKAAELIDAPCFQEIFVKKKNLHHIALRDHRANARLICKRPHHMPLSTLGR